MPFYDAEYDGHAVHEQLLGCEAELIKLAESPWLEPERDGADFLDAISARLAYLRAAIATQDKRLVVSSELDALLNAVTPLHTALTAFNENRTWDTAKAAYDASTVVLAQMRRLPLPVLPTNRLAVDRVVRDLRGQLEDGASRVENATSQATADIGTTTATSVALVTDANAQITSAIESLNQTEKATKEHLDAAVTTANNTLDEKVKAVEAEALTASETIQARLRTFSESATEFEERRDTAVQAIESAALSQQETFKGKVTEWTAENEALLTKIEQTDAHARKMLADVGGASLSGRWISRARHQMIERYAWIGGVAAIAVAALLFGWTHLVALETTETSVAGLIGFYLPRLPLAIITITVLTFAVTEAAKRADFEARDQRVANELTAFPAFLDAVGTTDRQNLAREIATKYFPGTGMEVDHPQRRLPEAQRPQPWPVGLLASIAGNVTLAALLVYALTK